MSNLNLLEMRIFEDLFDMASGYVLDFSNRTFEEFVRESVSKEIYSDKYAVNGDSKAKRLRAFLKIESDPVAGKLLYKLMQWREQIKYLRKDSEDTRNAYAIIERLVGTRTLTSIPKDDDESAMGRIWGKNHDSAYRVFLSHTHRDKIEAEELKNQLGIYGIRCFVAHVGIQPSQEWLSEIEIALFSMDALIAMLTKDFHSSLWTDQEIGHALGRRIHTISIRLGSDPYGFIGKYQALPAPMQRDQSVSPGNSHWDWQDTARDISGILIQEDRMISAYIEAVRNCQKFSNADILYKIFSKITSISSDQINELISAYNQNSQVHSNYSFLGSIDGKGLVYYLNRLSDRKFQLDGEKLRERDT